MGFSHFFLPYPLRPFLPGFFFFFLSLQFYLWLSHFSSLLSSVPICLFFFPFCLWVSHFLQARIEDHGFGFRLNFFWLFLQKNFIVVSSCSNHYVHKA
ncbi:hypothetical protein ACH5RR_003217, partial [Cinchona calisaya]